MPRLILLRAAAAALVLACEGEGITEPSRPQLSIFPSGGDNQTGLVGTTLSQRLIVQVTGVSSPNGQVLNFVVTSGGGSVFANVVLTSGMTLNGKKQNGIAENTWTLGPNAGAQTLEARLVDPETGATLTQAIFHATALAGNAAALTSVRGARQSAVAGTPVDTAPAVRVTDAAGNPLPGVPITFQVTGGGGGISSGPAQVSTGADGVAAVGGWTLGPTAGSNTLTASRAGLAGSPVTFTATGRAGPAARLVVVAGDGQHAPRGTMVPIAPVVAVQDSRGNAVPGFAVTFTITSGFGSMDGIGSVTTLTDATGRATVGWTLGGSPGDNTLRATALGLAGSPITFGAVAYTPLYVTNIDGTPSITVYEAEIRGDQRPARKISGPSTGLDFPTMVVRDLSGRLYVANYHAESITIYAAGADGDAAPIRTIAGPNTGINSPYGITRDPPGNIYVANVASHSITVYASGASGNVAPLRTIAGPNTGLVSPTGLRVDPSTGELFVGDNDGNKILVYARDADGNATPVRTIQGPNTGLSIPSSVEADALGFLYVTNAGNHSIRVFPPGANGDVAPARVIAGSLTGMSHPVGLARSEVGLLYVANYFNQTISVFAGDALGNVPPLFTISGSNTAIQGANWVAF